MHDYGKLPNRSCDRRLIQDDRLGFEKCHQTFHAAFAAEPRLLEAAEADREIGAGRVVSDGAGTQSPCNLGCALGVVREDGGIEARGRR
ncbi:hypothetical protein GCM10023165_44530 [Variovorax defluvii]|uniref:HD Cas3-type domain-containing protein n=1 Tax=Variovorax defluvii TaxID=913761 RepID=A0ABP8I9I5_9BURK